jgi:hypothetical protein
LVESTGRAIREDKRGYISPAVVSIVRRVGIDPKKWLEHVKNFGRTYSYCAGSGDNIVEFANYFERKWAKGAGDSAKVYSVG